MNKGIFGSWFKELATLIFTQTIQAFLLAIIMSIIVGALGASTGSGSAYGAGLLAIIALSQFGKIELLIKNIFGVTSQFNVGMEAGRGGLLGAWGAMRGIKNLSNNAGKIVGGTAGAIKSGLHTKSLLAQRKAAEEKLRAQGSDDALAELGDVQSAEGVVEGLGEAAGEFGDNAVKGMAISEGMKAAGISGGSGVGISSADINALRDAIAKQTEATKELNNNQKKEKANKDLKESQDKLKALDAEIEASKNKTKAQKLRVFSGVAETAAAIPAGVVGATVGLASGNAGKAVEYGLTAAGVADKSTESIVNGGKVLKDNIKDIYKETSSYRGIGSLESAKQGYKKSQKDQIGKITREYNEAHAKAIQNEMKYNINKKGSGTKTTGRSSNYRNNKFDAGNT